MRYREIAKKLRKLGCQERRRAKGSHRIWHNPTTNKATAVPYHGSKDLAAGTVRAILRELGIKRSEFGPIK